MKRLRPRTPKTSWPARTIVAVAFAIYVARVVHGLLTLLSAEWSSYGAVVTTGTVVLAVAGLVALVVGATRRSRRNIGV